MPTRASSCLAWILRSTDPEARVLVPEGTRDAASCRFGLRITSGRVASATIAQNPHNYVAETRGTELDSVRCLIWFFLQLRPRPIAHAGVQALTAWRSPRGGRVPSWRPICAPGASSGSALPTPSIMPLYRCRHQARQSVRKGESSHSNRQARLRLGLGCWREPGTSRARAVGGRGLCGFI